MSGGSELTKRNTANAFIGKFQPMASRVPEIPPVDYAKGGCDFRCTNSSSFGRQVQSGKAYTKAPVVVFSSAPKFGKNESVGPGPLTLSQPSSLGKQKTSNRRSNGACHFGTSTREAANRLYTLGNSKKH